MNVNFPQTNNHGTAKKVAKAAIATTALATAAFIGLAKAGKADTFTRLADKLGEKANVVKPAATAVDNFGKNVAAPVVDKAQKAVNNIIEQAKDAENGIVPKAKAAWGKAVETVNGLVETAKSKLNTEKVAEVVEEAAEKV